MAERAAIILPRLPARFWRALLAVSRTGAACNNGQEFSCGNTRCDYKVRGMVSSRDSEGAMRADRSKDMSAHVSVRTPCGFNALNASRVELVALVRSVRVSLGLVQKNE